MVVGFTTRLKLPW